MRSCFAILLGGFLLFALLSCQNGKRVSNPEDLAVAFFTDLKSLHKYEDYKKLIKYFPTRDEMLDLLNKTGESGNVDELNGDIDRTMFEGLSELTKELFGNRFEEEDRKCAQLEANLRNSTPENYQEKRKDYWDYLFPLIAEKMKNVTYQSFTRGKSKVLGQLDIKVPGYANSHIHFRTENSERSIDLDFIAETKNGWKIFSWD